MAALGSTNTAWKQCEISPTSSLESRKSDTFRSGTDLARQRHYPRIAANMQK